MRYPLHDPGLEEWRRYDFGDRAPFWQRYIPAEKRLGGGTAFERCSDEEMAHAVLETAFARRGN